VLTVCAHPDDESFGLGALLSTFAAAGTRIAGLCFTHGEASTLGGTAGELAAVRTRELAAAARVLGLIDVELLDYPDGGLTDVALDELAEVVAARVRSRRPDALLVFDEGGITGHPDHQRATDAARRAASTSGVPVLAWAIPHGVAAALNAQFGTRFVGRDVPEVDARVEVDRRRQARAIACHGSQSTDNPVLWRRLELLGDVELLRWLRRPVESAPVSAASLAGGRPTGPIPAE
jgi:N-acetylglucosamine malate deacetylase 2